MRITDLLSKESIVLNTSVSSKSEAIDKLVDLQAKGGNLSDTQMYKTDILAREKTFSTAVGDGIAIPHTKSAAVKRPGLAAITVPGGVDFESLDGKPSNLLFMIAAPENGSVHLEVLSRLMTILMDEDFRRALLAAKTAEEFLAVIDRKEMEKYFGEDDEKPPPKTEYKILAVTACPTGIAHTYMAAEALEKAGKKLGYSIKIETNGSIGTKNALTKEDIEGAEGIIITADKAVEMSRFDGKKLISAKVTDGISKPEELINKIVSGEAKVYNHSGDIPKTEENKESETESLSHKIYKHLMNGVSNMLPFVVGGGIFIALAFLIDSIAGAPHNSSFGSNTPVAAFFKTIGGYAFSFMIPILAAYIGKSIADRPGFLIGFVGGFLATTGSTFTSVSGSIPPAFSARCSPDLQEDI